MSAISARADLTLAAGKTAGIRMRLCKSTMFALCAILAMLRLIDITAQAADPDKMHFRVVNSETLKPVSNARLTVIWTTNFPDRTTNVVTTDDLGTCLLPIYRVATREWGCSIEVFKDGNVPKYVSWSERQGDEPNDIPQEYMTKLAPGVSIGAVVVNESGEPVPDARVVFDVFGYQAPARSLDRERLTMTSHYHVETADDHGRWHCSHVPAEFGMIRFKVAHPEYAPRDFGSAALGPTTNHGVAYLAQAELRNATAVMPLAQGAIAAGIVVDESDRPVAGAKVTLRRLCTIT